MVKLRDPETCPKCHTRGTVVDSRKRKGYRRRTYRCRACAHRWAAYLSTINPRRVMAA